MLYEDVGLANPERRKMTFTPLASEEKPSSGQIVGLDAEFVSLNQVCKTLLR